MSDSRKKSGVMFWTAVAMLVVLLYVASIGPATWLEGRYGTGDSDDILSFAYRPVIWTAYRCPELLQNALQWYLSIGLRAGDAASFDEESISFGTML